MKTKHITLSFDLESYQNTGYSKEEQFEYSKKGLEILLNILKVHNIKTTFFTTYFFAQKYPLVIRRLIKEGHEIASHGYRHSSNYKKFNDQQLFQRLKKSKDYLEKEFNVQILGFRAPRLQKVSPKLLRQVGFKYDSSLHPTFVPFRYFNIFKSTNINKRNGLLIVPISVSPVFRFPFSWIWFKKQPLSHSLSCLDSFFKSHNHALAYFHPWEFNESQKDFDILRKKFLILVNYLKNKGVKFVTIESYLKQNGFITSVSNL